MHYKILFNVLILYCMYCTVFILLCCCFYVNCVFNLCLFFFLCTSVNTSKTNFHCFLQGTIKFFWFWFWLQLNITQYKWNTSNSNMLRNALKEFLQIWYKCPLWLKCALIRIWWQRVWGRGHCVLTKHIFGHYSNNYTINAIKFYIQMSNRRNWWC